MNPLTNLLVPGTKCELLPAGGYKGPVPPGYFIHPDTGRVLPEAGNLGYDLQSAALMPTTDICAGETMSLSSLPIQGHPRKPTSLLGNQGLVTPERALAGSKPLLSSGP